MRDIKFRQPLLERDKKFNQWHYWGNVNGEWASPAINTNGTDTRGNSQQYTGLKDKNGKEIYEGDIVNHSITEGHEWSGNHEVRFIHGTFKIYGGSPIGYRGEEAFNFYPHNLTVIGNIYESPELCPVK